MSKLSVDYRLQSARTGGRLVPAGGMTTSGALAGVVVGEQLSLALGQYARIRS